MLFLRSSHSPRELDGGFTILELMVVMALGASMSFVALIAMPDLSATFDRMRARTQLTQDLKRAQAETVTKGCRGVFTIDGSGEQYRFGCDYLPLDETSPPAADLVFFERDMPYGTKVQASGTIIFSSRGQAVDETGEINAITLELIKNGDETFATGILLGTGAFSFDPGDA